MSPHNDPLSEQASLALIAADAKFFLDLALNPRLAPIRSTAILALMPTMSAFLYESVKYTKQERPEALQALRPHQELLRASRMRMKLLDGDPRTLEGLLNDADELVAIVKNQFVGNHRGILGPRKRLLQTDVGIHLIQNEISAPFTSCT